MRRCGGAESVCDQSLGDINENTVTAGMKVADLTVTDAERTSQACCWFF